MVEMQSQLTSPAEDFSVTVHDTTFPTEALSSQESRLFESQFNQLLADLDSSVFSQILSQRSNTIANVAAYAKQELDGKVFGGINAGDNEIGFSELRPGHIYEDDDGNRQNDWYFDPSTDSNSSGPWYNWIGNPDGSGSGSAYNVNEDQVSVVLAFTDQSNGQSVVSGLNVQQWGRNMDMLPHDLNSARLSDNDTGVQVRELPTLIARDGNDIQATLRFDRDAERQPRFFGVTFGLGSFLNSEDY